MSTLDTYTKRITNLVGKELNRLETLTELTTYDVKSLETVNKIISVLYDREATSSDSSLAELSDDELLESFSNG